MTDDAAERKDDEQDVAWSDEETFSDIEEQSEQPTRIAEVSPKPKLDLFESQTVIRTRQQEPDSSQPAVLKNLVPPEEEAAFTQTKPNPKDVPTLSANSLRFNSAKVADSDDDEYLARHNHEHESQPDPKPDFTVHSNLNSEQDPREPLIEDAEESLEGEFHRNEIRDRVIHLWYRYRRIAVTAVALGIVAIVAHALWGGSKSTEPIRHQTKRVAVINHPQVFPRVAQHSNGMTKEEFLNSVDRLMASAARQN